MIRWILLLTLIPSLAIAAENISGGAIAHCTPQLCLKVTSKSLSRSPLDLNVWNFQSSAIEIAENPKRVEHFSAAAGYVDLETEYLVLKRLKNSKHKDLLLNLQTGKITYF